MNITLNGNIFKIVSYSCGVSIIPLGDTTQTLDGTDHISNVVTKRVLTFKTADLTPSQATILCGMVKLPIIAVYTDTPTNTDKSGIFLLTSISEFVQKMWNDTTKMYEGVEITLTEKGAQ